MRNLKRYKSGFTLIELLVALMVTSIIFTAVATLAYALSSANDATDDTSLKQAQLRYATLRISELIRHCKLVCNTDGNGAAIWRADDDDNGQININELVYIDAGAGRDHIRFYESNSVSNAAVALGDIDSVGTSWWLGYYSADDYTEFVAQCSNVQFVPDETPPNSKSISVSFEVVENEVVHQYQINTALRSWAGYLLDGSGNIVSDDD